MGAQGAVSAVSPRAGDQEAASRRVADYGAYKETLAAISVELDAVEEALGRLDERGFGSCATCGSPVGAQRLAADPLLTTCPAHTSSERPVAVLAADETLSLGGEQPDS